ncbi:hypothetical protein OIO90_000458 [Microbotryomycetes sp. JL221]|nr:hypothetical protein OIO90_000458 [Microbotryomycetes sp. JL221]
MDFKQLMEQAARNSAQTQAQIVIDYKQRQEQERQNQIKLHKQQLEQQQWLKQRQQEQQQRQLEQERERQQRSTRLPQTTNLYQLKQERIKRGLDPNGTQDHLLSTSTASQPQSYKDLLKKAAQNSRSVDVSSSKTSSTKPKPSSNDVKFMTREEKSAKRKQALFDDRNDNHDTIGSMTLAKHSPLYNNNDNRTTLTKPIEKDTASNSITIKRSIKSPKKTTTSNASSSSSSSKNIHRVTGSTTAKDRLKANFDPTKFIKLNTDKRDLRTIEEIESDMRNKKNLNSQSIRHSNVDQRKPTEKIDSSQSSTLKSSRSKSSTTSNKRPRSNKYDSTDEDDSDDSDHERYNQRQVKTSSSSKRSKSGLDLNMRDEIWRLMGRNRSKDIEREFEFSDQEDDDLGMEATSQQVFEEEKKSIKFAKKEDQLEQEIQKRKALEKLNKKKKK